MTKLVTPKQVAQAIGVSESSLKRWCDKGLLASIRTAGGHRRLALDEVFDFLRRSDQQLVLPELLGLPSNTGEGKIVLNRAHEQIYEALVSGDEEQCRRIAMNLYLSGISICEICDHVLASALQQIGDRWECGEVSVYRERRACEIGLKVLHELRSSLPNPAADAPIAIGGTLDSDPYRVPTAMIEVILRELGWRATSLGSHLPTTTIAEAIYDTQPKLLWVSVSSLESVPQFLEDYASLQQAMHKLGGVVVVGGRALTAEIRQQMVYSAFCDNLRHLVSFVDTLYSNPARISGREAIAAQQLT